MKTIQRATSWLCGVALLVVSSSLSAAPGFNQTDAGPYDYNTGGNWVGGTINGTWDSSLTLVAGQNVTIGDASNPLNVNLTLGANATLRLSKVGTASSPIGDYVLIKYTGTDPAALGNWTVDYGTTGWSNGQVVLDTASKQVLMRFNPSGTVLLAL